MQPFEWMVCDTPQTLWIEKKGLMVWLAEVFGVLGGGLYLVGLYFNNFPGLLAGWFFVAGLKSLFHFAHLGRPFRFWRLIRKPGSSWLARGFLFVALFIFFGALQLALSSWLPGTPVERAVKVAAGITALLVATYAGFVMNYVKGISLWNSALLPLLFLSSGLSGGLALLLLFGLSGEPGAGLMILSSLRWLLVIDALLIMTYLLGVRSSGPLGERSVRELTRGRTAAVLWWGVLFLGLAIPLGLSFIAYYDGGVSALGIVVTSACTLTGVFSLNYCLLKGASYGPLIG